MNAIEHGNDCRPDLSVRLVVAATDTAVLVTVTDRAVNEAGDAGRRGAGPGRQARGRSSRPAAGGCS